METDYTLIDCEALLIKSPFRIMIAAPSNGGKTTLVREICDNIGDVFATHHEDIIFSYAEAQPQYETIAKRHPHIQFVKGLPESTKTQLLNRQRTALLISDDQMVENMESPWFLDLYLRQSHHCQIDVLFLLHNFYFQTKLARTISLNTTGLCMFKSARDRQQIGTLARQMRPGKSKANYIMQAYDEAVREPFGYLFLDFTPHLADEKVRFRNQIIRSRPVTVYTED